MNCHHVKRRLVAAMVAPFPVLGMLLAASSPVVGQAGRNTLESPREACSGDNGGITLPSGFCATVFADNIGHARHLAVSLSGIVYVNTWSGRYYGNDKPPPGGFLVALQDTKGDDHADVNVRFGDSAAAGSHGGTGIALYRDWLYAEVNDRIVRYQLPVGTTAPTAAPEVVVSGLPLSGDHPMHPFVIDARQSLCGPRLGNQFLPGPKPDGRLSRPQSLYRT